MESRLTGVSVDLVTSLLISFSLSPKVPFLCVLSQKQSTNPSGVDAVKAEQTFNQSKYTEL